MKAPALLLALLSVALRGCMADPADGREAREALVRGGCGACHRIPGVPGARGKVGPPLEDLAGRVYIGGRLPNTPEALAAWIENPPAFEPRTAMPAGLVSAAEARAIANWLLSR